jgi:hypothetical protein
VAHPPKSVANAQKQLELGEDKLDDVNLEIGRIRSILVDELILEVFDVKPVEGTNEREWTICGVSLGLIGDMRSETIRLIARPF